VLTYAFVIASIAYTIYSYVAAPKPSRGAQPSRNALDSSPTYGWEGIRMTIETGIPVPISYGEHLIGGNLITCFVTSDGEKNYLNMLIALCEGEIEGIMKEDLSGVCPSTAFNPYVLVNDNPLSNFQNVWWDYRLGTQDQNTIQGFSDIKNTFTVGGVLITGAGYIYTTVGSLVEAFELRFRIPALYSMDAYGNMFPRTVTYHVYHKVHGAADWTDDGESSIVACSRNTIRRYWRKDGLSPNQYDIKVVLISNPPVSQYEAGDLYLDYVVEIKYDDIAYVHTALLALKILATDQLSGNVPNVLTRIRGRKNKNLETSVVAWNQNPIYCVNDTIVTERFGLGRYITQSSIDIDQLISMAHYCDEIVGNGLKRGIDAVASTSLTDNDYAFVAGDIGKTICSKSPTDGTIYTKMAITSISGDGHTAYGTGGWSNGTPALPESWEWGEKRFQFDIVVDALGQGLDLIQTLCASFRACPIWIKDAVQILIDKKESPSYIFNMGNIIAGSFKHSFGSEKKKPNVIEVQYANVDRKFERETVEVDEKEAFLTSSPRRVRKMSLLGATRQSQIYREGRFHLRAAQYQDEAIGFRGGIDAIHSLPGDVVKFQHDVPQWGYGGRIMAATINSITIDQEVQIEGGFTYVICVKFPGAGGAETLVQRTVTNGAGYYTTLNVTPDWPSIPPTWGLYLFGKQNQESKPFRIMRIGKTPQNEIEVEAAEYSDQVYVDTDVILPTSIYSDLPNPVLIPHVENLESSEGGIVLGDGTWVPYIEISFKKPETSGLIAWSHAEIYISNSGGNWYEYYGKTDKDHGFKIENHAFLKIGNTVRVKAVSVAKNGTKARLDTAPFVDELINGKVEPPSGISGFTVQQFGDKLLFSWVNVSAKDISHYEIREGATWQVSQLIVKEAFGTTLNLFSFAGGVKNYMIKAVDRHGNYSQNPAQYQISVTGSSITNLVKNVDGLTNPTLSSLLLQWGVQSVVKAISLIPSQGWDDAGYWDDASKWDIPVSPTSGYFETEQIDIGLKKTWMILLDSAFVQDGLNQTATIEIRTSDNGADWSAYSTFVAGEFNTRWFQLKCSLSTTDANENIFCIRFTIQAGDSKLFQVRFSNQTIAVGGTTIAYGYTFGSVPSVQVTPVGATARVPGITSQGVSSCVVKLFDSAGSDVGGTANISIEGY
jgi:predicted phage tail protein